jgi:hypothetical protein
MLYALFFVARLYVLMVQLFHMQVIGLSSTGIDNWGHVSVGVYHPWFIFVPLYFIFLKFVMTHEHEQF